FVSSLQIRMCSNIPSPSGDDSTAELSRAKDWRVFVPKNSPLSYHLVPNVLSHTILPGEMSDLEDFDHVFDVVYEFW
ncbi:hypothetical protein L9F63_000677, partial [Diploptera punctata]